MKHAGKTRLAGIKIIVGALVLVLALAAVGVAASLFKTLAAPGILILLGLWFLFAIFSFNFFRDPDANAPQNAELIVSPAHGTVDVIDETVESEFMGGRCKRISIFLSVFDVHVQNAPISGKISHLKYTPGKFLNAMRTDCATCNENVLLGFDSAEKAGEKIGVRLIAGLIARRIVPWVSIGDEVARGERISLVQFGSRADLYMPLGVTLEVKLGDKVVGGESIVARRR
jgi:phosphatidylserine decarboxylase